MANCNINTLLANASCFNCLSEGELAVIELQLLCEILSAGGTGTGSGGGIQGFSGNYGGGQPTSTPTSGNIGYAVDTSNGRQWVYYSGAWH